MQVVVVVAAAFHPTVQAVPQVHHQHTLAEHSTDYTVVVDSLPIL